MESKPTNVTLTPGMKMMAGYVLAFILAVIAMRWGITPAPLPTFPQSQPVINVYYPGSSHTPAPLPVEVRAKS